MKKIAGYIAAFMFFALYLCLNEMPANAAGISVDEVHFPDEEFRRIVSESIDTDKDGSLSSGEVYPL